MDHALMAPLAWTGVASYSMGLRSLHPLVRSPPWSPKHGSCGFPAPRATLLPLRAGIANGRRFRCSRRSAASAAVGDSEVEGGRGRSAAVIGAAGFVGSHIVRRLLCKGYKVNGSARDPQKARWLQDLAADPASEGVSALQLHSLDLAGPASKRDNELDGLLTGTDAAYFCAGFERQEPETIDFMVDSALAVIHAARRQGVGCVVLTSSGGSTNPPGLQSETPKMETEHWSDPDVQKANGRWSPAAKTLMELSALKEVGRDRQNKEVDAALARASPRLCIMNPNLILGPQLKPGGISGNSLPWILSILKGERMTDVIPNDSMSIIDVRDLAELHIACAERLEASGRYFGVNRSFAWEEILAAFKNAYPSYHLPTRFEGDANTPTQFDFGRRDSLEVPLRSLNETVADLVDFFRSRGDLP